MHYVGQSDLSILGKTNHYIAINHLTKLSPRVNDNIFCNVNQKVNFLSFCVSNEDTFSILSQLQLRCGVLQNYWIRESVKSLKMSIQLKIYRLSDEWTLWRLLKGGRLVASQCFSRKMFYIKYILYLQSRPQGLKEIRKVILSCSIG